jgi:hypothetical protein
MRKDTYISHLFFPLSFLIIILDLIIFPHRAFLKRVFVCQMRSILHSQNLKSLIMVLRSASFSPSSLAHIVSDIRQVWTATAFFSTFMVVTVFEYCLGVFSLGAILWNDPKTISDCPVPDQACLVCCSSHPPHACFFKGGSTTTS